MKILYFDVETTGTDAKKNDVVQLSGAIEIDGVIKESFNFRMKPFDMNAVELSALEVTGLTMQDLESYPDSMLVFRQFIALLSKYVSKYDKYDKFYPAGYNVRFDLEFMAQWFKKCGDKYGFGVWQNWKAIDPLPIFQFMDAHQLISLPNYKLSTVCGYYGIEINAHDALSDITATKAVIEKVRNILMQGYVNVGKTL